MHNALKFCQLRGKFWIVCCVSPQAGSEHSSVCKWKHSTPEWSKELPAGDRSAGSDECRLRINVTKISYHTSFSFYLRHAFFMHGASLKLHYLRIDFFLDLIDTFQRATSTTQHYLRAAAPQCGRWLKNTWRWSESIPPAPFPMYEPTYSRCGTTRTCLSLSYSWYFSVNFSLKNSHQMFQQEH